MLVQHAEDPLEGLKAVMRNAVREAPKEARELGCPLNNLAQEMSPLDEGFRTRIQAIYRAWQEGTARALRRGQETGRVRGDFDTAKASSFIVACFEGSFGLAKNAQDPAMFEHSMEGLEGYLETLRPEESTEAA